MKQKNTHLALIMCYLLSPFGLAKNCPAIWNTQGSLTIQGSSVNFNWERMNDWFYADIKGPFNIKIASIIGNLNHAIWTTLFIKKQTPSNELLRKIIGTPYPMIDFFNILCGAKSNILKTHESNQQVRYSNSNVTIIAKDFHAIDKYRIPFEIEIKGPGYQTQLLIHHYEIGQAPSILSKAPQTQIKHTKELQRSPVRSHQAESQSSQ